MYEGHFIINVGSELSKLGVSYQNSLEILDLNFGQFLEVQDFQNRIKNL